MGWIVGVQSAIEFGVTPTQDGECGGMSGWIGGASNGNSNGLGDMLGSLGLAGATNGGGRALGNSSSAVAGSHTVHV